MGTATNSLPIMTQETKHLAEANWLAVPDFSRPSLLPRAARGHFYRRNGTGRSLRLPTEVWWRHRMGRSLNH